MEEKAKETLRHFDSIFDMDTLKNIDFNNMKLLKVLFNYFEEDLYTPSLEYEKLRTKQLRVSDKMESTFTEEQQKLFEQYWEITSQMSCEEEQQLFLFGYIIATKLNIESNVK